VLQEVPPRHRDCDKMWFSWGLKHDQDSGELFLALKVDKDPSLTKKELASKRQAHARYLKVLHLDMSIGITVRNSLVFSEAALGKAM